MTLPFTAEQFLSVFIAYNQATWPALFVLLGLAVLIVIAAARDAGTPARVPAFALASIWAWSGIVYHLFFFRQINGAAIVFGSLFLIQAVVLIGMGRDVSLSFRFTSSIRGWTGGGFILYAIVVYPILGYLMGHRYPASPTFGAPCPVTIFTLGLLLWSTRRLRWFEFAIPLAWAAIGTSAVFKLGMIEDLGLSASALIFVVLHVATRRMSPASASPARA
jgi:hypothetical protein